VTDVRVEFVGGPLDGVVSFIRAMATGEPPDRFDIEVIGGGGRARHDYRIGPEAHQGDRWRYEYAGVRPRR
jgi:hypothetical protein